MASFFLGEGRLEVGAEVNDSPVDCQSRERPRRAVRAASHSPPAPAKNKAKVLCLGFVFLGEGRLEVGAEVNDSPVDCQSRERPRRVVRAASHSPPAPANKKGTFVYQKFLFCLSKPQAWHIIAAQRAVHIIKGGEPPLYLITRQRASSCGLMICNALH